MNFKIFKITKMQIVTNNRMNDDIRTVISVLGVYLVTPVITFLLLYMG